MNKEEFQSFRERFNRFENGFNELVKDQNKKNEKWDKYSKQYTQLKDTEKSLIKLNVGGFKFTTTKSTLLSLSCKFFEELLSSSSQNEEIFIDRPGKIFEHILNTLRGKKLNNNILSVPHMKYSLIIEAKFYGVKDIC